MKAYAAIIAILLTFHQVKAQSAGAGAGAAGGGAVSASSGIGSAPAPVGSATTTTPRIGGTTTTSGIGSSTTTPPISPGASPSGIAGGTAPTGIGVGASPSGISGGVSPTGIGQGVGAGSTTLDSGITGDVIGTTRPGLSAVPGGLNATDPRFRNRRVTPGAAAPGRGSIGLGSINPAAPTDLGASTTGVPSGTSTTGSLGRSTTGIGGAGASETGIDSSIDSSAVRPLPETAPSTTIQATPPAPLSGVNGVRTIPPVGTNAPGVLITPR